MKHYTCIACQGTTCMSMTPNCHLALKKADWYPKNSVDKSSEPQKNGIVIDSCDISGNTEITPIRRQLMLDARTITRA
jgi:hypothetical protein